MTEYIKNLTDHLIGQNRFDNMLGRYETQAEFERNVAIILEGGALADMKGPKLGEIFSEFEWHDLYLDVRELSRIFETPVFSTSERWLRTVNSVLLARVIANRLVRGRPVEPGYQGPSGKGEPHE